MYIYTYEDITHHKCNTKFIRHDIIQNRVNRRRDIIEYAGYVGHEKIEELDPFAVRGYVILGVCPINGDQSLNMKWCPTNKKCYHHCNCNKSHNISVTFFQNIVLLFIHCLLFKKEKLLKNKNVKCSYDGCNWC